MSDLKIFKEFSHELVKKFIEKCPECYQMMNETDHNDFERDFYSEWHMEGNVWTHTMMVYSHYIRSVEENGSFKNYENWKLVLVSILLHDVGKCYTRKWYEDKNRIMFRGHSGVSTIFAIKMIQELLPECTEDQIVFILRLINYHQDFFDINFKSWEKFQNSSNLFLSLIDHRQSDYFGNISFNNDNIDYKVVDQVLMKTRLTEKINYYVTSADATFLIGLPCSGKSTYAKKLNGVKHSRDDIVMELYEGNSYNKAFENVDQKEVDRIFRERFEKSMLFREDIVIDRTNLTYKGRMKFVNQLRQNKYKIIYKVFLTDFDTIIKRNESRISKTIPIEVFNTMMGSFKMPYDNEFDEIEYIF